jgi:autotransporter-associated beta strand protein
VTAAFKLSVTGGGFTIPGGQTTTDDATRSGSYQLLKKGGGTLVLDKPNTHSGGTVLEAGTIIVKNASALGTGQVRIKAGATLVIDPAAGEAVAESIVIEEGGFVDLGTGRIRIVAGMTATALADALAKGRGDGFWTTLAGIGSSAVSAAVGIGMLRTIGWLDNSDGSFTTGFAAQGDTNMDGAIDILDAAKLITSPKYDVELNASWIDGDFNYDGSLDILDLTDFLGSNLFDQGSYLVSASFPAATSTNEPIVATAESTTALAIDAAFAALASDSTATPAKRTNAFASFR